MKIFLNNSKKENFDFLSFHYLFYFNFLKKSFMICRIVSTSFTHFNFKIYFVLYTKDTRKRGYFFSYIYLLNLLTFNFICEKYFIITSFFFQLIFYSFFLNLNESNVI